MSDKYCGVLFPIGINDSDALYCNRLKGHDGGHARIPGGERATPDPIPSPVPEVVREPGSSRTLRFATALIASEEAREKAEAALRRATANIVIADSENPVVRALMERVKVLEGDVEAAIRAASTDMWDEVVEPLRAERDSLRVEVERLTKPCWHCHADPKHGEER